MNRHRFIAITQNNKDFLVVLSTTDIQSVTMNKIPVVVFLLTIPGRPVFLLSYLIGLYTRREI